MQEIIDKYSVNKVLKRLNIENFDRILEFLKKENCYYIEDIVDDYLDLFTIEYDKFVEKYNELNSKYNNEFLKFAGEDMNLFEEFFND